MVNAYKKFWLNYFNFNGRSTRSDYWYVVLANFLIGFIIGLIAGIIPELIVLAYIYEVLVIIPGLSVAIRRLHDINKSGWNYLWILVPIAGPILLIIYYCTASVNENNKYGEIV